MGRPTNKTDTCDWCGRGTSSLQMMTGKDFGLCPSCCPDVDESQVPENAPPMWYHMSEEERQDWKDGMTVEEIIEKHDWHTPPDRSPNR